MIKTYLNKAFQENNLGTTWWIRNIKNILEFYGQVNHIQNIFKIIEGEISAKMIANLSISSFKKEHQIRERKTNS